MIYVSFKRHASR